MIPSIETPSTIVNHSVSPASQVVNNSRGLTEEIPNFINNPPTTVHVSTSSSIQTPNLLQNSMFTTGTPSNLFINPSVSHQLFEKPESLITSQSCNAKGLFNNNTPINLFNSTPNQKNNINNTPSTTSSTPFNGNCNFSLGKIANSVKRHKK